MYGTSQHAERIVRPADAAPLVPGEPRRKSRIGSQLGRPTSSEALRVIWDDNRSRLEELNQAGT